MSFCFLVFLQSSKALRARISHAKTNSLSLLNLWITKLNKHFLGGAQDLCVWNLCAWQLCLFSLYSLFPMSDCFGSFELTFKPALCCSLSLTLTYTQTSTHTHTCTHTNIHPHTLTPSLTEVNASVLYYLSTWTNFYARLLSNFLLTMWTVCCMTLSFSIFSCFLLCDWLLMVRMRPCAEGAQAPHWFPLCSCYCCHCSCAVSGQSHNASSFSLSLSFYHCLKFSLTLFGLWPSLSFPWCFSSVCFPRLIFSCVLHLCSLPVSYLLQCFPSVIILPVTFCYLLPPSVFTSPSSPPCLFLTLANIFSISPDFELQTMLCVPLPIYHYQSQAINSSFNLHWHLITNVARR